MRKKWKCFFVIVFFCHAYINKIITLFVIINCRNKSFHSVLSLCADPYDATVFIIYNNSSDRILRVPSAFIFSKYLLYTLYTENVKRWDAGDRKINYSDVRYVLHIKTDSVLCIYARIYTFQFQHNFLLKFAFI